VAGPVAKVSGFDALTNVRIDPSGDTAFAFDGAAYVRYQRTGDLVWSRGGPIARFASYTHATTATAGANPHVLLGDGSQFIELEDDGTDTWSTVTGMYSGTMFAGATMISRPTWTVDGLRLVFVAASLIASPGQSFAVMYASRQNIGDTFGPAVEAAAFEPYVDPSRVFVQQILGYLDDDCGRFYFAALSSVLYAQQ